MPGNRQSLTVLSTAPAGGPAGIAPPSAAGHFDTGPRSISAVRMLRISVTDRCNFRCTYCMPPEGVRWLPQQEILTFEEFAAVVEAASSIHRVDHIKLTGGEPTLRRGLCDLASRLRAVPGVREVSLTTNGFSLVDLADPLRQAGVDRVTVSLDSLDPERFHAITRTGRLDRVLAGIERALHAGFSVVKLNCVVVRGVNDDEVEAFAALTLRWPVTVRFIEYMPLGYSGVRGGRIADEERGPAGGCGTQDRGQAALVPEQELRRRIEAAHGPLAPVERDAEPGVGPAVPWRLDRPDALGRIGFISAMSKPFCDTCNRLRLTATGILRSCLFEGGEIDLKPILRPTTAITATPTASAVGSAGATRSGADMVLSDLGATPAPMLKALADAMARCVTFKPIVHSAGGSVQMSQIGG